MIAIANLIAVAAAGAALLLAVLVRRREVAELERGAGAATEKKIRDLELEIARVAERAARPVLVRPVAQSDRLPRLEERVQGIEDHLASRLLAERAARPAHIPGWTISGVANVAIRPILVCCEVCRIVFDAREGLVYITEQGRYEGWCDRHKGVRGKRADAESVTQTHFLSRAIFGPASAHLPSSPPDPAPPA